MSATPHPLQRYYRTHACIYDASRWLFLFGRQTLIQNLSEIEPKPRRILEIGCGTGKNLMNLQHCFPQAQITGIDLSADMLQRARRKLGHSVDLRQQRYQAPISPVQPFDLILLSYTLSMINPGWHEVIGYAKQDLAEGGRLAVVDFAGSSVTWFKRWMWFNHVHMDHHLMPMLQGSLKTEWLDVHPAYGGLWQYFLFVGRNL